MGIGNKVCPPMPVSGHSGQLARDVGANTMPLKQPRGIVASLSTLEGLAVRIRAASASIPGFLASISRLGDGGEQPVGARHFPNADGTSMAAHLVRGGQLSANMIPNTCPS